MPGPQPPAVPLSAQERHALHTRIRAPKPPHHLRFRAQVRLLGAAGRAAPDVARRLGTTRTTVRRWRRHWRKRHGCPVPARLQDARRPGAPATCRAAQWCQSSARACEPPEASGRPSRQWTPRARAAAARQRSMVEPLSARHGGRFFQAGRAHTAPKPRWAAYRAGGGGSTMGRSAHPLGPRPRLLSRWRAGARDGPKAWPASPGPSPSDETHGSGPGGAARVRLSPAWPPDVARQLRWRPRPRGGAVPGTNMPRRGRWQPECPPPHRCA